MGFINKMSDEAFNKLMGLGANSDETSSELSGKVFENLAKAEDLKLKGSKRYTVHNGTPIKRR